jgi:transcriptional regulator with GAF, ATPase, and Fis domain
MPMIEEGTVDTADPRTIGHRVSATAAPHARALYESRIAWASPAMSALLQGASEIGASDAKVLIGGETGAGKEVVARYVHASSPRAHRSLVTVNCAALSDSLLESELFGHARGSFTGAYRSKIGLLQLAHQSTLFLDEVGEMSPRMQALLLRFLENGEVQPVGADGARTRVDVRVIAATNVDLDDSVAAGRFRSDLLYRLRVIYLLVPPLRDRREDIPVLVEHFLKDRGSRASVSDAAMQLLVAHHWPGNVREVRNVVEQMVARAPGDVILPAHLPSGFGQTDRKALATVERRRNVSDELYQALVAGQCSFWDDIHPLFLLRDITRHDIRQLVRRGLAKARGNYHALLTLFGLPQSDYKRFLNFLTTHDCSVDYRPFRNATPDEPPSRVPHMQLLRREPDRRPKADAPS